MENDSKVMKGTIAAIALIILSALPAGLIYTLQIKHFILIYPLVLIYSVGTFFLMYQIHIRRLAILKAEMKAHVQKDRMISSELLMISNEDKFKNVLALEIERLRHFDKTSSVVFFDVDSLGEINDAYGYDAGDQVLIELIRLTKSIIGGRGQLGRIKGDTYAIMLPDQTSQYAFDFSEKLKNIFETTYFTNVGNISCRFAVVALHSRLNEDKAMTIAYEKLKQAKTLGKGTIV